MFTTDEADALLAATFPWRATVERPGEWRFVSLRYHAVEDSAHGDTVQLRFERDPGDTVATVTRTDLLASAATGQLSLGDRVVRQPEADDAVLLAEPFESLIGYQSTGDPSWVARMRLHQSWWRTFRLRVPFGFGPNKGGAQRYGNMLDDEAAAQGDNFLSPSAASEYETRVALTAMGVDPWRTKRNLLASQPMAFNVFGHLAQHLDLATALFDALLGDVAEVTHGEIERLSTALDDHTAFDAFFTLRRTDGSKGCVAIETKLTEPFSQRAYDWEHYVQHPVFAAGGWSTTDGEVLGDSRWSQLWRNHLLALAELTQHPEVGQPTVLVVHHPSDPHCATNVAGYQELLSDPNTCRAVDLGEIVAVLRPVVADQPEHHDWLERVEERYLRLDMSAPLISLNGRRYGPEALPPAT